MKKATENNLLNKEKVENNEIMPEIIKGDLIIFNKKKEEDIQIKIFYKNCLLFNYKCLILFKTINLSSLITGLDIKSEENFKIYFLLIKKACFISQNFVNSFKKANIDIDEFTSYIGYKKIS